MIRLGIAKDLQQCKAEEITLIDDEYTADIKAVAQSKRGVDSIRAGAGRVRDTATIPMLTLFHSWTNVLSGSHGATL